MKGHLIEKVVDPITHKEHKEFNINKFVTGSEVIRNNIEARCSVIRGELLYNVNLGIVLGMKKDDLDLTIMSIINNTLGVKEINKYMSKLENKEYMANIYVTTVENESIAVEV